MVACYGLDTDWHRQSRAALDQYAPDAEVWYVDTTGGGHPTKAYIDVYRRSNFDRFLFIQDTMTALADPRPWFRDQFPADGGAVAWGLFPMSWDSQAQIDRVVAQYGDYDPPDRGIFGPVFYTDRASLDALDAAGLLPWIPGSRVEAQGTERAWAFAFRRVGLKVEGPVWNHASMQIAFGPFRKVWAGRP